MFIIVMLLPIFLTGILLWQTVVPAIEMTPEAISILAGACLSLLFAYVPGFATWYQKLGADNPDDNGTSKRLVMLALLLVTVAAIYGLTCAGIVSGTTCNKAGIVQLVWCFILAVIANQSTFPVLPKVGLNESRAATQ